MTYEDELNEESVVLEENTPETAADTAPTEPLSDLAEVTESVEVEEMAEPAEESAQELAEEAETVPEAVPETEEAAETPDAPEAEEDADLSEAFGEELDFDFEVEETPRATDKIAVAAQQVKGNLQDKYDEARSACKSLMERLTNDLEQTNYNPYIRTTTTRRYEILRNAQDTEPVDTFEIKSENAYSLRAMAIAAAVVAVADVAVARMFKKK